MANTIKLKNASGSDPSASDLVVGEVALRTDNAALFTKKDDGSVAQIGATVSNSGATFTIDNDAVTFAKMQDITTGDRVLGRASNSGAIEEVQINNGMIAQGAIQADRLQNNTLTASQIAANAIGTSELADDSVDTNAVQDDAITFAKMQNIDTARILGRDDSGSGTVEQLTAANVRTMINVENGATADQSASEIKTAYESNSNTNAFTDARLSKLNGIASGATNVTNTNQLTNGAGFITATLTNEEVQDIVGGMVTGNTESGITVTYQDSDGTLDFTVGTLNQNTTGNAATATKLATARTIAGVSFDGSANISLNNNAITNGAGYITSADGGNAATLDGIDSSQFVRSDASDTLTGATYTFNSSTAEKIVLQGASSPFIRFKEGTTNKAYIQWNSNGFFDLINQETNEGLRIGSGSNGLQYRLDASYYTVWHAANDGSGSGLDSDTVDGIQASSFLRSDTSDTCSGAITFSSDCSFSGGGGAVSITANSDISFASGTWSGNHTKIQHHSNALYIVGGSAGIYFREGGTDRALIDGSGHLRPSTNNTYNLGTSSVRWANVFTNDLSLSNEGSKNDVDATWGSYTIQEGHHDLFLINKRTGKKYKFNLTEVN